MRLHITLIWRHKLQLQCALCVTDRAGVQPIGRRLTPRTREFDLAAKQSHAAQVCRLMVSTLVIHVITRFTTHLPTPKVWKAELAWMVEPKWILPTKWSHVSHRSGIDMGKSASHRPTF